MDQEAIIQTLLIHKTDIQFMNIIEGKHNYCIQLPAFNHAVIDSSMLVCMQENFIRPNCKNQL